MSQLGPEVFRFAFRNLTHQGLRSYLTLLGVVIGIASIVTLVSLGAGLNNAVVKQFEQLGSNTLFITVGAVAGGSQDSGQSGTNLKTFVDADVEKIRNLPETADLLAPVVSAASIEFGREKSKVSIIGFDPKEGESFADSGFFDVQEGRTLEKGDGFVALIGSNIANDIFEKEVRLRDRIMIEGRSFRVIGVTKESAQSFGGGPNTNDTIFISLKAFEQIFPNADPVFMLVRTKTKEDVAPAKAKVERIFEQRYGKDQKEVVVNTSEQILASIGSVLGLLQLFLAGVASISLLVGGIGIMNTMVMAVLERTQEIGVMKAIGATNTLILSIFLLEAGMIGLVGGVLGVGIGYLLSFGIGSISSATDLAIDVQLDFGLIAFALLFSMLVGMVSGLIPARNAAGLEPVVALRGAE